jgi:hypothetical protein
MASRYIVLGAPNQYRGVSYVSHEGGQYRCMLCETGGMNSVSAKKHFNGSRHLQRHSAIAERQRKIFCMRYVKNVYKRILPQIRHSAWRDKIKSEMCDFVTGAKGYNDCELLCAKLFRMEALTSLELALWKARITDGAAFSTMQDLRDYPILDSAFDVDTFASDMRISCGSQVVIPLVLEYLGTLTLEDIPILIAGCHVA